MSTELQAVSTAVAEFDRVAAGLAELQKTYGGVVYPVVTADGMEAAKAARLAIREPRYEVERVRKAAKAPILALGKKLDSEAERITAALLKIETPIDEQVKAEEKRKEDEKQARIAAELKRVTDIQERIGELRGAIGAAANSDSDLILEHIGDLERVPVDDTFAEFRQQAEDAKAATLARLREMHAARLALEAEAERIKAERAELARLRAEQDARNADERARLIEQERVAAAERAEQERKDREAQAAENARRKAEQDARDTELRARQKEQDRVQQERAAAVRAEEARLATERAELARREAAVREAEKPKPAPAKPLGLPVKRPTDEAIIKCVATGFGITRALARIWIYDVKPIEA